MDDMKNPWIAAVLNLIPGLGYFYLGVRTVFAGLLLGGMVAMFVSGFDPALEEVNAALEAAPLSPWEVLGMLLLTASFVVDGYKEAVRVNASASKKRK
jgi:hypothetical protein